MKLFLKSIAFFATCAMLFTACSEDDTTDGAVKLPEVQPSEISSAPLPGNGRVRLTWEMPDDENITGFLISWSGDAASEKEVSIAEARITDGNGFEMADTVYLASGNYTFTVENIGVVELDTEATSLGDVYIYDANTYTEQPTEASVSYSTSGTVEITWGTVPTDHQKLIVSYRLDSDDIEFTKETFEGIAQYTTSEFDDAKRDTYYEFTSYYRPALSMGEDSDYVKLLDTEERLIPESDAAAAEPKSLTVQPGDSRVRVSWTTASNVVSSHIQLYDGSDNVVGSEVEITSLVTAGEENEVYLDGGSSLSSGKEYYVVMYNKYTLESEDVKSDAISVTKTTPDTYESDKASSKTALAKVYATADYIYSNLSNANNFPTCSASYASEDDNMVIDWGNYSHEELEGVVVTYDGSELNEILVEDMTSRSSFSMGTATNFTYKAKYCPAGGCDVVYVDYNSGDTKEISEEDADLEFDSEETTIYKYKIRSGRGLKAFANLVAGGYNTGGALLEGFTNGSAAAFGDESANTGISGQIVAGSTVDLLADGVCGPDINGRSVSWVPIGNNLSQFAASFDGNGVDIENLYINTNGENYQGLFGQLSGTGTIQNVTLVDPKITVWEAGMVAAVIGRTASTSTVTNCHVEDSAYSATGSYTPEAYVKIRTYYSTATSNNLGAIVAYAAGSPITNCTNQAQIVNETTGYVYTGGIVGNLSAAEMTNCHNFGDVDCNGSGIGGIIGYSSGAITLTGCSNTGNIDGVAFVAGIAGYISGGTSTIAACYNTGNIAGTSTYIGGVAGRMPVTAGTTIKFVSCYNTGSVYSSNSTSNPYIGGVSGCYDGYTEGSGDITFDDCYFIYEKYANKDVVNPVTWAIGTSSAYTDRTGYITQGINIEDQAYPVGDIASLNSEVTDMNNALTSASVDDSYRYQAGSTGADLPELKAKGNY